MTTMSWTELSEYLTGAMQRTRFQPYLSITENARRLAAQAAFAEIRELIVPMVTAELADRAEAWQGDGVEAAWRDRYPDADELTLRRLAGDR